MDLIKASLNEPKNLIFEILYLKIYLSLHRKNKHCEYVFSLLDAKFVYRQYIIQTKISIITFLINEL